MTLFVSLALLLTVLVLVPVLLPLLRPCMVRTAGREALNVALFQERRDELAQELAEDAISAEQYEAARLELERDLLLNAGAEEPGEQGPARTLAAIVGVGVPLLAALLYLQLGAPDFVDPPAPAQHPAGSGMDMAALTQQLAKRLEQSPGDVQGWMLLGRSLVMQKRYQEAAETYERALERAGGHPDLLTDYAEMLALQQGSMRGKARELVERALRLDPDAQGALWLAGVAAFEEADYTAAISHWQQLQKQLPEEGDTAALLRDNLNEARARLGEPQPLAEAAAMLRLHITLAPALAARAQPDQVLFIMARPPEGGMPIAALRRQVRDLPLKIVLDDSAALGAGRSLGDFKRVEVVARISRSGNAAAASGDLEGSVLVDPRQVEPVEILIGKVRE
ncbi:c-type cytochrome biogenesis protein CcmI [Sulfurivermis fontis]|uniref:c-type cytochrome biogenesis protein CcmI n=1 Tax=Sulfurivermis fontis TaxID=1972068 RepID=UPI000FDC1500|nr:c-type cytochrome biogenesis protein CcmI [Sulfurivermis fontis]